MTPEIADKSAEGLKRRFRYMTDPDPKDFNPTYATAAYLDPQFALDLNNRQREAAQSELKRLVT